MIVQLRVGENKKEIDVCEVERLAAMGLSVPEIAQSLKVGKSTLERKLAALLSFKNALRRGRERFKEVN